MSLLALPRLLPLLLRPTIDALFTWNLPWRYRWRTLILQPITFLTFSMSSARWLFTRAYTVEYLPIAPGRTIRALIFKAPSSGPNKKLHPLHIDIHGGAFIGGWPEEGAVFCDQLARETGAVVISISYRYAPKHVFPAAHDDVDAAIRFLQTHAEAKYGADPGLLTMSGFSAGGTLALAAAQAEACRPAAKTGIKACVTFYAVCDLRLKPQEKPVPVGMPDDPAKFLVPLYDSYVESVRAENMENPRMSPILASVDQLPENLFVWVAAIDILVHEQTTFVEKVKQDLAKDPKYAGRRVEIEIDEKGFHGYLNLPDAIISKEKKQKAFSPAVKFIKDTHVKYGFEW
ncbi:Alpha/Beta hydrolase protein [Cercophora newfieldiana]|uniref:Alpha/Beta hydrolase protein n=1 Tax=Cercophora newfieldiana TaxID=92897 RepID=A0AA40CV59_9PEZI|nr:Alpha/Beta hydrolase protein [Cercophora newfieldiana]